MNKIKTIGIIALFLAFLAGCGNSSNNQATDKDADTTSIAKEVKKIVYPLPTPFEVTEMLNKSGAGFIFDIVNPINNVEKYSTEKSKALNLGVYGADLSYASTYNKTQEVTKILACSRKLTEALEINTSMSQKIQKRIDANIENKDSVYKIVNDSYYDTFDYLNTNNKGAISVLILTGGWIEGLFISTELATTTKKNDDILVGIAKQKNTAETLMKLLDQYKSNASVAEITIEVIKIKSIFDNTQDKITKDQLNALSKVISEIRTKIVQTP